MSFGATLGNDLSKIVILFHPTRSYGIMNGTQKRIEGLYYAGQTFIEITEVVITGMLGGKSTPKVAFQNLLKQERVMFYKQLKMDFKAVTKMDERLASAEEEKEAYVRDVKEKRAELRKGKARAISTTSTFSINDLNWTQRGEYDLLDREIENANAALNGFLSFRNKRIKSYVYMVQLLEREMKTVGNFFMDEQREERVIANTIKSVQLSYDHQRTSFPDWQEVNIYKHFLNLMSSSSLEVAVAEARVVLADLTIIIEADTTSIVSGTDLAKRIMDQLLVLLQNATQGGNESVLEAFKKQIEQLK